jgi:hypothetical protein
MAQIQRAQRSLRNQSAVPLIFLSATLFFRTQSSRKSLADRSSQVNPQTLFPINRRPSVCSGIPILHLEVA